MIAATLQTALDAEGKTDCILVSHDWGAVLSTMLQRKYPHLIRKLVMHDVEVQCYDAKWYSNGLLLPFVFFGWIYQYILASAFLMASIPVIGVPIGTMITHIVTQNQAAPLCQDAKGKHRTTAMMNYPYLWFHWQMCLEMLGLQSSFDQRHNIKPREHGPPTLFIYVTSLFHSKRFEQQMRDREDCDVVRLTDDKYDHWYIYSHPSDGKLVHRSRYTHICIYISPLHVALSYMICTLM